MPKTTPFHPRLEALNRTKIWDNWAGYLTAPRYQYSDLSEYYAIRNSAGLLDTSPLFKYRFSGADATKFLMHAMARDIRKCRVGQAQYTTWCDDNGFVIEDGVIVRTTENDYLLTAAEPNLRYFRQINRKIGLADCQIDDVSADYGILALQGPHSLNILRGLTADAEKLRYFRSVQTEIGDKPVLLTRTGFTGDLGYELWIKAEDCLDVWDTLMAAGKDYNITPLGLHALKIARVEAGLLLLDVDFSSTRYAWVDAQRETPIELGWEWMFRGLHKDDRDFIGRVAIESEIANKTSRWKTVGLTVDWHHYQQLHREAGIMPPLDGVFHEGTMNIYRQSEIPWDYAGYATSLVYSSILRKHIAIAKLPLDLCEPGSQVSLEITIIRRSVNVLARVAEMPFFNPNRKTNLI